MNKGVRWLVLVVVAVLLAPPLAAHASPESDRQAEIQAEIEHLRGELDEVAADEAAALADLRVTQRRKAEEETKLADLDKVMTAAMGELTVAESKLQGALAAEQAAHRKLESVQGDLRSARDTLRDQAVASFMRYGSGAEQLDVLLQSQDINELHHAKAFVDTLAETQTRIVARFTALQQDSAALEATASKARDVASTQKAEVESRTAALQAAREAQASATATADAEAAHEESLLASLRGQRAAYERRIREQQRESDEIADLLRRRGNGGATISGHGSLSSPLANPIVTSTYGYRVHPIFGDRRLHSGVDLRASTGTPIKAAAPGEVVFAGWRGGYGNCTIVDHGGGVATLYAHQSALKVAQGDEVTRGQVIGAAGSTGNATGPHLHFEVRVNGVPVDPMPYL